MIRDLRAVYTQVKESNLRFRNGKRPFLKKWHVIMHYTYFFFLIHKLIEVKGDDVDRTKSMELFLYLCRLDLQHNFSSYEHFEKVLSKEQL